MTKPATPSRHAAVRADPRMHARRASVARRRRHRRLYAFTAFVVLIGCGVGGMYLVHSSWFSARHIEVIGEDHTSAAAVIAMTDLSSHPPLVDVNTAADDAAIERLPWVLRADVSRDWPDTVHIKITERIAIADIPLADHSFALIDEYGRVLAKVGVLPSDVVTLEDAGRVPSPGSYLASRAEGIVAAANALPIALLDRVTSIGANATDGIVVHLAHGPLVIVSSSADLHQKMVSLATVLARTQLAGIVTIDLRVPSSPVLTR